MGGSKAARQRRIRRVLELSTAGMTIPDISAKMKQEGFAASERTVWNDQHSVEAQAYQEELLRKQLSDITIADIGLRLKYRGRLLDKLMPTKMEVTGDLTQDLEVKIPELKPEDVARYTPIIFKVALEQETREPEPEAVQEDPAEPVDRVGAASGDRGEGTEREAG